MKRRKKCPVCRAAFESVTGGRRRKYCSRACRQKAYRERPERNPAFKLLANDIFSIQDRTARARGAVRVLEDLGYEVTLTPSKGPKPRKEGPPLRSV